MGAEGAGGEGGGGGGGGGEGGAEEGETGRRRLTATNGTYYNGVYFSQDELSSYIIGFIGDTLDYISDGMVEVRLLPSGEVSTTVRGPCEELMPILGPIILDVTKAALEP